jgi:hypothetical protein
MWKQSQTRACSLIMLSMKSQDICILLIGKIKLEKKKHRFRRKKNIIKMNNFL